MQSDQDFEQDEEIISKSQRKRDMLALQELVQKLLDLPEDKIVKTGINSAVLGAISVARKMKASGARNRQIRYITKLLSHEDTRLLEQLIRDTEQAHLNQNRQFHELENWRDRLIEQGDAALNDYLDQNPVADRQQLRQLIRTAQKELQQQKPPAASRKLFKYLRQISEE